MFQIYTGDNVERDYSRAKELYGKFGVDADAAMKRLADLEISMHCWQGDDVTGLEVNANGLSGGGIMATGNYPGKARNGEELRSDMKKAMSLIPGRTERLWTGTG